MRKYAKVSLLEQDLEITLEDRMFVYNNGGPVPFKNYDYADSEFLTWFKRGLAKRMIAAGIYPLSLRDQTFLNFVLLEGSNLDQMRRITHGFAQELGANLTFQETTAERINRDYKWYGGVEGMKAMLPGIAPIIPAPDMSRVSLERIWELAQAAAIANQK